MLELLAFQHHCSCMNCWIYQYTLNSTGCSGKEGDAKLFVVLGTDLGA